MSEKNLDFDKVIDRKNTGSVKYDFTEKWGMPEGILPFWVADMDFKTSSYIQEAVIAQAGHGIYGYTETNEDYFKAVRDWFKNRHNWEPKRDWLVKTPGVVFGVAAAIRAFSAKGDGVLIEEPVYYPFKEIIKANERKAVISELVADTDGQYRIDFEDFENKIKTENVKIFILCNPHNPGGRVYTEEELIKMGDICLKYGVIVVSDEIHCDFVHRGRHRVFASLKSEYTDICAVCTSPSKTFNIAGLQVSNIFIPNKNLRNAYKKELGKIGMNHINAAGITACVAAYKYGGCWYEAMLDYVRKNIAYTKKFIEEHIPEVKMIDPEGTYLIWLDFRDLRLDQKELDNIIIKKAGLWLDSGEMFGSSGKGYQRINVACPLSLLKTALEKLERALHSR